MKMASWREERHHWKYDVYIGVVVLLLIFADNIG